MNQRIIRAADCPPQPWRNGLGLTREIARFPADADTQSYLWRVSVAEVDSAAPFSAFPGIDRHIVLLDGDGFSMTLDGIRVHRLQTPLEPFAFPGEAAVEVTLAGGSTRDFNLMVRRAQARGSVAAHATPGRYQPSPSCVLVYAARGRVTTADGTLHAGDAWLADGGSIELDAAAQVLLVQITAQAASL